VTDTVNNAIPYVPENTIDPAAGLNLSLNTIDALLQCRVISIGDNDPPSEAVDGDRYIVGDVPTNEWSEDANRLAVYLDGAWDFYDAWIVLNASDNLLYINNSGVWSRVGSMAGSFLWADRPSAFDLPGETLIFISDFPTSAIGSWWKSVTAYGVFSPFAGDILIGSITSRDIDDLSTEQIVDFIQVIPENMILPTATKIAIDTQLSKSTGAIDCTYRIRIGDTGTTADPVVHTVVLSAAARTARISSSIYFPTATSVTACPTDSGEYGESTTVWPADITIPDVTENPIYITLSLQMGSTGGTATVKNATCNML